MLKLVLLLFFISFLTDVSAPEQLSVTSVTPTSAELIWSPPQEMDHTPFSYQISYYRGGSELVQTSADSCSVNIEGLKPCTVYSVNVCTKSKDGKMSEPINKKVQTGEGCYVSTFKNMYICCRKLLQ